MQQLNPGPLTVRLISAAASDSRTRRQELIERMAADLILYDAVNNEQDSIRSLYGRGYKTGDIMSLLDDARQVAMQAIVALEMAKS